MSHFKNNGNLNLNIKNNSNKNKDKYSDSDSQCEIDSDTDIDTDIDESISSISSDDSWDDNYHNRYTRNSSLKITNYTKFDFQDTTVEENNDSNHNKDANGTNDGDESNDIKVLLTSKNIPSDFHDLIKKLFQYTSYNSITIETPMSIELYNYLSTIGMIDKISKASLSKYCPLSAISKMLNNKIDWSVIITRKDLTHNFVKQNINRFNIRDLDYEYFLAYDLMFENISKSNYYYDVFHMLYKILKSKKYKYYEFMSLLNLLLNKNSGTNSSKSLVNDVYKLFIQNYYTMNSSQDIINLIKFNDILQKKINISSLEFSELSDIIVNSNLFEKLSNYDIEYLIENKIIGYYMGPKLVSRSLFEIFYNKRHQLINSDVNPFIMKGYNIQELEELIKISISVGIVKNHIWSYLSDSVLDLRTPQYFFDYYKNDIIWKFLCERILKNLDETDHMSMLVFMEWMKNNHDMIELQFIKNRSGVLFLPEIMIVHFINSTYINLHQILGLQRLSLDLLNYLVKNYSNLFNEVEWEMISIYQNLDPEFIQKYEHKLDWNGLKYNQTWNLYPHESFHKLPTMDFTNRYLWWTAAQKVDELLSKKATVVLDGDYIILTISNLIVFNHQNNSFFQYNKPQTNYRYDSNYVLKKFMEMKNNEKNKNNFGYGDYINNINYDVLKNRYILSKNNKNWVIRNQSSNIISDKSINNYIIPNNKYNKAVYTLNSSLMDGNINSWVTNSNLACNHHPLILCDISLYHTYYNYQNYSIRVHHKDLMIVDKNNYHGRTVTYIYLPLDCNITVV
jgi:hypothetical protein